jgi:hypothetical protein
MQKLTFSSKLNTFLIIIKLILLMIEPEMIDIHLVHEMVVGGATQ